MSNSEVKTSEILKRVIPRGKADMVARFMGVSADYVRRWMRDIATETNDDATGMKSPVAKTCDLMDVCALLNRKDTPLIAEVIQSHLQSIIESEASEGFGQVTPQASAANLLKTTTEAVNSLNIFGGSEETLRALVYLNDVVQQALCRTRVELARMSVAQAASGDSR